MLRQEPWNIHEAVILLDALLEHKENNISRAEAVLLVSEKLRSMAQHSGKEIDDIFRNANGISFQMSSMESALAGHTIMKPATRLFSEVVEIYRSEPERYKRLLEEAKVMVQGKRVTNEEKFIVWLSSKVSPAQLSELYVAYKEIDDFCIRVKVLKRPLFETLDYTTARKVQQTIESNKAFRMFHRKSVNRCIAAATQYCRYLKELRVKEDEDTTEKQDNAVAAVVPPEVKPAAITEPAIPASNSEADEVAVLPQEQEGSDSLEERIKNVLREECNNNPYGTTVSFIQSQLPGTSAGEIKKVLTAAPWATTTFGAWKYLEKAVDLSEQPKSTQATEAANKEESDDVLTVDFKNIPPLVYTKPVSFTYFGDTTEGLRTWSGLYLKVFSALYEDYPHLFHVGSSFTANGEGRVELGDASIVSTMVAPKRIPTSDGKKLFLETNLSANNLVGKMKFLLDLCSVDYENLVIKYRPAKPDVKPEAVSYQRPEAQQQEKQPQQEDQPPQDNRPQPESVSAKYVSWMLDNGCALPTTRSYSGAIRYAEGYARLHSFAHQILFTDDHTLAVETASELFEDKAFVEYNKKQHNRFRAAITKLFDFYGVSFSFNSQKKAREETTVERPAIERSPARQSPVERPAAGEPVAAQSADVSHDISPFFKILAAKFVRGFRLGSPLDMKKFRRYYEEQVGEPLTFDDTVTEAIIRAIGVQYNDKVFAPDAMLSAELREKLFEAIRASFAEGKNAVYYEALFRTFSESFLDYYIYDANMLRAYIAFYNNGEFHVGNQYISKDAVTEANPPEEIKNYLVSAGRPIETEEICAALSHIPEKKVLQILGSYSEFVHNGRSNGKGYYFHVCILHLTEEDLENISILISDAIREKTFVSGNELMEMIKARHPYILESNPLISMMGMRDALKYHLCRKFSFRGNIISAPNSAISMADVFGEYARSHAFFTMQELINLTVEMNSTVYFDAVYDNSLRISQEQFVSKEYAQFRVADTDRAIARFCPGPFIPIGKIREFGTFPDAGHPWTSYLLEHFVYQYSKEFKLLHAGFNRKTCVGAIVRREAGIESFNDLLSLALAESTAPIKRDKALSFFVEQGYLARRNYSDIESVLLQATVYRNKKGTK